VPSTGISSMRLPKLFRRLKAAWQAARQYEEAAQKKEEVLGVPINTRVAALALVNGFLNRENVCRTCLARYKPRERDFAEKFQVRAILRIPDNQPDPMFCDACWDAVVMSYNRQQSNVGTSNSGPPNLALRRLIAKE